MAADGEARGQEIPVCVPLTKMSKAAAEEMSVAGDPSKLRILRSYQRVNGRSTVPGLRFFRRAEEALTGGWAAE